MAELSKSYASPGLRLGLLLEDHPRAEVSHRVALGAEVGIPEEVDGGANRYVVARIVFNDDDGRVSVEGWKVLPDKSSADDYNILCTKATGRALKRAGYPDDLNDLKALVAWRQRNTEIAAVQAGTVQVALAPAEVTKALEAAGVSHPEATGADDGDAPDTDAEVVDGEVVEERENTRQPTLARLRQALSGLDGERTRAVNSYAKKRGVSVANPAFEDEALDLLECIRSLAENIGAGDTAAEPAEPAPAPDVLEVDQGDVDDIPEVIEGLSATERKTFEAFCKTNKIDAKAVVADPRSLKSTDLAKVLGWLNPEGDL